MERAPSAGVGVAECAPELKDSSNTMLSMLLAELSSESELSSSTLMETAGLSGGVFAACPTPANASSLPMSSSSSSLDS